MKKQLFLILLSLLPIMAYAEQYSGSCGDNLTWRFADGTLTISGNGDMYDYWGNAAPWSFHRERISTIEIEYGVTTIGEYAFYYCGKITSISLPNSVVSIGDHAFSDCKSLQTIDIPNSVTEIGRYAFLGCASLQTFNIPNSVTKIADYTFGYCHKLKSIAIPNSVTSIGANAFNSCISLTSIEIPNSIVNIEDSTFMVCSALTYIEIPNNIVSIGRGAFGHCYKLKSIAIPNSVTSIGANAFNSCRSLTSIEIPNSVVNIEDSTFLGCSALTYIEIPNNIVSIGRAAFHNCTRLTSIDIPSSIVSIEDYTFNNCSALTSIEIPGSVTSIGRYAFGNCCRLNTIYCLNLVPPTCYDNCIFDCSEYVRDSHEIYSFATLHVPMGSKEMYESFHGWRYFQKIKEDMEIDGNVYYANLTVQQGTTGYTRQSIKAGETYTIYIGTFADNRVNAVTFNGIDVTDEIVNGNYTTPEIKGESVLCISYEVQSSVPSLKLNNVRVTGYNGEITVSNIDEPSDICIYSTDGKLVNRIPSAIGSAAINVSPEQLYIVNVGSRSYKIAL